MKRIYWKPEVWDWLVLAVVLLLAVVLFDGCAGNPPPDWADLVSCLAGCKDGTCVKNTETGRWECRSEPETPSCTETGCPDEMTCNEETGDCELKPVDCSAILCEPGLCCEEGVGCVTCPQPTCEPPLVWNETAGKCAVDAYTPDGERRCVPPEGIVKACWNKPPGGEWSWIPDDPTPPPPTSSYCPLPEGVLTAVPGQGEPDPNGGTYHGLIVRKTAELGSLHGLSPAQKLQKLADAMTDETGWCWFAGKEAIFVLNEAWQYEEYHAVSFADGGWTNSGRAKFKGFHLDKRTTDVGLHHPDPRGLDFKFNISGPVDPDTTLTTVSELEYCRATRQGKYGVLPRAGCPVRPEGQSERVAWERVILGAQTHTCNGQPMPWKNGNPAVAKGTCHGEYTTCSEDRSVCTTKVFP